MRDRSGLYIWGGVIWVSSEKRPQGSVAAYFRHPFDPSDRRWPTL